jgi:hypothetical protein
MENKYYTPELEEFCIGFEYEVVYEDNSVYKYIFGEDLENSDGFIPWISPDTLLKYLAKKNIRVKYLNPEDITECGWISGDLEPKGLVRSSNEYFLNGKFVSYSNYEIRATEQDNEYTIYDCDWECVFKGIIKNKSELKKLMQMLNIQTDAK